MRRTCWRSSSLRPEGSPCNVGAGGSSRPDARCRAISHPTSGNGDERQTCRRARRGVTMRYLSTRGEAAERDFSGVLLTGLAGGWRPLAAGRMAAAGRSRARAGRGLCGARLRGHPPLHGRRAGGGGLAGAAGRRLCGLPPPGHGPARAARHESLADGAVPRADLRLQGPGDAGARAAVRPRAEGARRTHHHHRRDLRRHRRGSRGGGPRARDHRPRHALSARAHFRCAAPADDDGRGAQYPHGRAGRHVRRLPGPCEGALCRHPAPRGMALRRRQLDQLGPRHGPDGLLRPCGGAIGRRAGRLRRAERQFRQCLCGLRRARNGSRRAALHRRLQQQRHPRALLRGRATCPQGR